MHHLQARMKTFALFLFFFVSTGLYSQEKERKKMDSLAYEITVNLSSSNPVKAHRLADSLFVHSSSTPNKILALILSAEVYKIENNRMDMLQAILQALDLAKTTEDYYYQSKIYGYLSTMSREIGLYTEGRLYLQKGIDAVYRTENPEVIDSYIAMANWEFADFEIESDNYEEALHYLDLSVQYYRNFPNDRRAGFLLSRVEEVKARCYLALNNHQEALNHFKISAGLHRDINLDNTLESALIYQGLGETYLLLKNPDSSYFYLKRALAIAENSSLDPVKEEIYSSLVKYYDQQKEKDSTAFYRQKLEDVSQNIRQAKKHEINDLTQSISITKSSVNTSTSDNWWLLGGAVLFVLGGFLFFIKPAFRSGPSKKIPQSGQTKLSDDTVHRFEQTLITFKKSRKYLDPGMNFSAFVKYLNTNSKYLNEYLKNYLNTDYNTYINDLRINYITERIQKNKNFRQYKVSHLAKESGFSSHSNFSANFKRVTGLTPSQYIAKIGAGAGNSKN